MLWLVIASVTSPPEIFRLNHYLQHYVLSLLSVSFPLLVPAVNDGSQTHDGEEKESPTNGGPYQGEKCVCLCLVVRAGWQWRVMQWCWAGYHCNWRSTRVFITLGNFIWCVEQLITITSFLSCSPSPSPSTMSQRPTISHCSIKTETQCQKIQLYYCYYYYYYDYINLDISPGALNLYGNWSIGRKGRIKKYQLKNGKYWFSLHSLFYRIMISYDMSLF